MHYLAEHENLDAMVARLHGLLDRPVFIASCLNLHNYGPPRFRRPGGTSYEKVNELEAFLSTWKVLDYDHKTSPNGRDLTEADAIHIVYPLRPDEHSMKSWIERDANDFKSVGLYEEINSNRSVFRTEGVTVPDDLAPYVAEYTKDRRGEYKQKPIRGILFAISEAIERPRFRKEVWHVGYEGVVDDRHITRAATLHPPGHYSGRAIISSEGLNNVLVLEEAPGDCVVCHGQSGERVHVAFASNGRPSCHICRKCSKDGFAAWQQIMDEWAK